MRQLALVGRKRAQVGERDGVRRQVGTLGTHRLRGGIDGAEQAERDERADREKAGTGR